MIFEIVKHTPVWVFVLFSGLFAFGYYQHRARSMHRLGVALLPAVMLIVSFLGVVSVFGASLIGMGCWGAGVGMAVVFGLIVFPPCHAVYSKSTKTVRIPGSWLPLGAMMAIFFTKYAVGVTFARQLPVADTPVFCVLVSGSYGFFSGLFLARALLVWRGVHQQVGDAERRAQHEN